LTICMRLSVGVKKPSTHSFEMLPSRIESFWESLQEKCYQEAELYCSTWNLTLEGNEADDWSMFIDVEALKAGLILGEHVLHPI
jgi:hypothetical protein